MKVNRLVKQAERDLDKIRITPEIEAAAKEYDDAWQWLSTDVNEARTIAPLLNLDMDIMSGNPLASTIRRINFVTREILEPDDPRITGVAFSSKQVYPPPEKSADQG